MVLKQMLNRLQYSGPKKSPELSWTNLSPFFMSIFLLKQQKKDMKKEKGTKIEWLGGGEIKV